MNCHGGKRTLGTQVPGVHPSAEMGTGRIQRVCFMQTRFKHPHLPPGKGGRCPISLEGCAPGTCSPRFTFSPMTVMPVPRFFCLWDFWGILDCFWALEILCILSQNCSELHFYAVNKDEIGTMEIIQNQV